MSRVPSIINCGIGLVSALAVAACAPSQIRPVADVSGPIPGDEAVIAFSVVSAPPFALSALELSVEANGRERGETAEVSVQPNEGDGQLFLYSLPPGTARFGSLWFADDRGWWQTTDAGPTFTAVPGAVTYLGRIELNEIQLGKTEGDALHPTGVTLSVVDASEEDLPSFARLPALPVGMPVRKHIVGAWHEAGSVGIRYLEYLSQRPGSDFPSSPNTAGTAPGGVPGGKPTGCYRCP